MNDDDIKNPKMHDKVHFRYLRALCYKIMGKAGEAGKDYN